MKTAIFFKFPITYFPLILGLAMACTSEDTNPNNSNPSVQGTIMDDAGRAYPNVTVVANQSGSEVASTVTNPQGSFELTSLTDGQYSIEITPPLASQVQGNNPVAVTVTSGKVSSANFTVILLPVTGLVIGTDTDPLGEIRTANGELPSDPNELLYARNVFSDQQLVPIMAPDGHHIVLSEWQTAEGEALINCNGETTDFDIQFTGLIPNGVYTMWVSPLIGQKTANSTWDSNDILGAGAMGNSTLNTIVASDQGLGGLQVSMPSGLLSNVGELKSCALTSDKGMSLILDYHIDGQTYGDTSGPDETDVGHMIFLF